MVKFVKQENDMPGPGPGGPHGGHFLTDEELKSSPKVTASLIKRVFSWLLPYWKQFSFVLVCIAISATLKLLPSILTGKIIDDGLIGKNFELLVKLIILSLAVTFIGNLIGVLEAYLQTWIAQHITFDMRNKMYLHLQKMSQRFYTSNNQGDIVTRMTSDIASCYDWTCNCSSVCNPNKKGRKNQVVTYTRVSGMQRQDKRYS